VINDKFYQYMEKWLSKRLVLISLKSTELIDFIPVRQVFAGHLSEMFKMTRRFYLLGGLFFVFPFAQRNVLSTRSPFLGGNAGSVKFMVLKFYCFKYY